MTMKYDKMIEITQAESQRKMEIARNAIADMLSNMERVTVAGGQNRIIKRIFL